ncbi:hypothetical protein WQE_05292, partial [Paraburkholderia hospita]
FVGKPDILLDAIQLTDRVAAGDLGLSTFLTFADQRPSIEPPKFLAEMLHRVRRLSQALSRKARAQRTGIRPAGA